MSALYRLFFLLAVVLNALPATANQPLFDAHLHYDIDSAGVYAPGEIVAILRANGVKRAVVTSYPPSQALSLYDAAPGLVVPFLGVYRTSEDKQAWVQDTRLPARLERMLSDGPWRGVGELHLFAEQRLSQVFLHIVELATRRRLPLLMHCDPVVIDSLFAHSPDAQVIWAHAGTYPYPQLLRDYLDRYPRLYVDLSVRDERIAPGGELDPDWENLLWEYPDRFLIGVDTFRAERWADYGNVAARIRGWLGQLPENVSAQIAYRNALGLFESVP